MAKSKTSVYICGCDPRFYEEFSDKYTEFYTNKSMLEKTARQVLAMINLHALLFREPVIQDNFLISKLFYDVYNISPKKSFGGLFNNGLLNVAFRESADFSLIELKKDMLDKINNAKLLPHEGYEKGIELYQQTTFGIYLRRLNRVVDTKSAKGLEWKPGDMGARYTRMMDDSAKKEEISGIDSELAVSVFKSVDDIAQKGSKRRETHSRTLYYNYAEEKAKEDPDLADRIRRWANLIYLQNLPDELSIESSSPRDVFQKIPKVDNA